ncbi:hypothetical protein H310_03817 [Aphanomyces invadans]|uniref:F5/8 type C domain-containing protein n=1 Tax=Aphanomyces invadans TaxID=157072 RepID=A0A024UFE8_9STRA|nr:hypothetical protein H310_03817 [Aphanomyces invadans]ETW04622.1 hypothetical protein H310_03817 [Aphanomyces invadans]|eukprot:XP_008866060.1 hypothetical protein H310_03817 [Aphanomyces invadans]
MQALDKIWFIDMPTPVEWHPKWETHRRDNQRGILSDVVASRNKITFKFDHELPPMNQEHDNTIDLTPIESDLRRYLDLVNGLHDICRTIASDTTSFQTLSWRHVCLTNHLANDSTPSSIDYFLDVERGMVMFALACVSTLQAEQQMSQPSHNENSTLSTVKDTWRRAAGLFHEAATRLPPSLSLHPFLHVWVQLCIVHAHAVEMQHVQDNVDSSSVQVARYHSALSRGGHSACVLAQTHIAHMHATSTPCHQLRWLVLAYKVLCKAAYCMNEVVLYESKPDIALLFCDAVIKSKLPMPPQYPHRGFVFFTKLMQTLVTAHQTVITRAMDMKSILQDKVPPSTPPQLRPEHVQAFLSIDSLQLNSLQPVFPPDCVDSARLAVRAAFLDHNLSAPSISLTSASTPSLNSATHEAPLAITSVGPVQVLPKIGSVSPVHFNADSTTSRDIRVAMRAHNLGLLPDSVASSSQRSTEWEYGVEPFTPRHDARQLVRGLSLPTLSLSTTSTDEPNTPPVDPFTHDPTCTSTNVSGRRVVNTQQESPHSSHNSVHDLSFQHDPPLTLQELDCLVGAKPSKHDGFKVAVHTPYFDASSSLLHLHIDRTTSHGEATSTPKLNHNMVTSKRKACALCTRQFPVVNLVGVVLMKRILELRTAWGLTTAGTAKCAPASYLYREVRVCILCSDILYGLGHMPTGEALPPSTGQESPTKLMSSASTPTIDTKTSRLPPRPASSSSIKRSTSIGKHVQQLRKQSLSTHTYATTAATTPLTFVECNGNNPSAIASDSNQFVDEIGYMIHQRILNDALLLHAPSQVHHCVDLTQRRRGVVASQSSVLMLGIASNAINPVDTHRGIHTREEQAPWWEVDLGSHCDISSVEVWNCADSDPQVAARLFPCYILLLLKPGHRRPLVELLGVAVDSTMLATPSQPLRWRPKSGSVCRYVRLVVDKHTYLHVERVHVFGTPFKDDLMIQRHSIKKKQPSTRPATAAATLSTRPKTHLTPLCKNSRNRFAPTTTVMTADISSIPMQFQQERRRTVGGPTSARPKSAGFLLPTESSHRRDQLTQVLREQLALEDQLNHPSMHQRPTSSSSSTTPPPTTPS